MTNEQAALIAAAIMQAAELLRYGDIDGVETATEQYLTLLDELDRESYLPKVVRG